MKNNLVIRSFRRYRLSVREEGAESSKGRLIASKVRK
jgi:hypothetical protein